MQHPDSKTSGGKEAWGRGVPGGPVVKNPACIVGDTNVIPGLG